LLLSRFMIRLLFLLGLLADSNRFCSCRIVLLPHDHAAREIVQGGEEFGLDRFSVLLLLILFLSINIISASTLLCGRVLWFAYKCVINMLIL
jgi:hypothetical protein